MIVGERFSIDTLAAIAFNSNVLRVTRGLHVNRNNSEYFPFCRCAYRFVRRQPVLRSGKYKTNAYNCTAQWHILLLLLPINRMLYGAKIACNSIFAIHFHLFCSIVPIFHRAIWRCLSFSVSIPLRLTCLLSFSLYFYSSSPQNDISKCNYQKPKLFNVPQPSRITNGIRHASSYCWLSA